MPSKARLLSSKEIQAVLNVLKDIRNRALFAADLGTGLRISKIIAIGQNKVFTTSGGVRNILKITKLKEKTIFHGSVSIHLKLREQLARYQKALDKLKEPSPRLFPSLVDPDNHIDSIRAHNILTEAFQNVGIEEASKHTMCGTCLTNRSSAGIPLRTIQEISGYSNLVQLQGNLAVDTADSHMAIMSLKY